MECRENTQLWDIEFLADNPVVRSKRFGIPAEAKAVRYPVRLLRYWFGYHLLRLEAERVAAVEGRPIRVAEVGVHTGQFLEFVQSIPEGPRLGEWLAVDAVLLHEKLKKAGYEAFLEANLEDPSFVMEGDFDVAVLLHILEHLHDPEESLRKVVAGLRPGGVVIGGFPVLPHFLIGVREKQVRKTAKPMGHVSIFSPQRVRRMADAAGCDVEFLSGAFLMRSKGSSLENDPRWLRFNLWWGQRFPSWPGEVYWLARKRG